MDTIQTIIPLRPSSRKLMRFTPPPSAFFWSKAQSDEPDTSRRKAMPIHSIHGIEIALCNARGHLDIQVATMLPQLWAKLIRRLTSSSDTESLRSYSFSDSLWHGVNAGLGGNPFITFNPKALNSKSIITSLSKAHYNVVLPRKRWSQLVPPMGGQGRRNDRSKTSWSHIYVRWPIKIPDVANGMTESPMADKISWNHRFKTKRPRATRVAKQRHSPHFQGNFDHNNFHQDKTAFQSWRRDTTPLLKRASMHLIPNPPPQAETRSKTLGLVFERDRDRR